MATLGSLLGMLGDSQIRPWDIAQRSVNEAETGLIALAEAKRKQAAEAELMTAIQHDPTLRQQLFGGSILGGLGPAGAPGGMPGGPPGGGPMTQQTTRPGQPPSAPQVVPGGQDLSQFATQVTPPQSTIASLGPPPQGSMPATRNPVLAMAQRDPRAAMMLQQQMQAREDQQVKRQEQQLTMGTKVMEYLGQGAQGVHDQASLDAFRQEAARVHPQAAASLPQTYAKEAMEPWIARALTAKDALMARLESRKLDVLLRGQDVELAKAQQAGGKVQYQTDAQGTIVVVPDYAPGGGPVQSRPVLGADGQPIKSLEGQKLTTQQQTQVRTQEGELRNHVDTLLKDYYAVRDAMGRIEASGEDPSAAGDLALITAFMKMLDPTTGVRDIEFKNAASAGGFLEQLKARVGYVAHGERLSDDMRKDLLTRSRKLYEQYEKDYGQVKQQYRDLTTRLGGNPANVVLETSSTAAKPSTTGKLVTAMSREELLAERDRLRKGGQ